MSADLDRRRSLLTAALGFALVDTKGKPAPKEVQIAAWEALTNTPTTAEDVIWP